MWQQVERILTEAAHRSVESVAAFMPGVLALMMILLVAVLLANPGPGARVPRAARSRIRPSRVALGHWGPSPTGRSRRASPTVVARLAQWTILLLGLLVGTHGARRRDAFRVRAVDVSIRAARAGCPARAGDRRDPRAVLLARRLDRRRQHADSFRPRAERVRASGSC